MTDVFLWAEETDAGLRGNGELAAAVLGLVACRCPYPRMCDGRCGACLGRLLLGYGAVASGKFRTLVLVLGYCGLRFGEATALQVADVDTRNRCIEINRSVTYVTRQGRLEGDTKNHTIRKVPIPKFLAPLLATEIQGRDEEALVFPSPRNEYLTNGEFRWVFDAAVKTVRAAVAAQRQQEIGETGETQTPKFPIISPHDLRHTCASLAISAGANIKVLQTLLGHKTATLTLDRYGHLFPDDLGKVADALDQMLWIRCFGSDALDQAAADWLRTGRVLHAVPSDRNLT